MAKFIQTRLVDADPAILFVTPEGDMDIVLAGTEIPEEFQTYSGFLVKNGFADEDGEHYQWLPNDMLDDIGLIPVDNNPHLATDAPSVSSEMVDRAIVHTETKTLGDKTTVVRATLWNGFEIVESSSCVSPENYNVFIGEACCLEKIRDKVWMLLGFLLQTAVSGGTV